ncbi:type 1 glutamine amidotransferase domain-containing protein [Gymnodinialimonas ceratoperidinii]|uniref:Type 1 glutamine amidotransferase n=1 Tax=Gymnodinialimonas ceratoperidinii TaxID=2856823 RepID=A0A8F6TTL1_9RHOB|nr:type 1 glutamine amidotransferase domain-containing protein [Gymnodinialimonas ceratoperidinii]QXT38712.1 type 1 glutamine amidotransferase [Gymnodinialimonas ceratoperidinii]
MPEMSNAKILIMSTHGFEQSELEVPLKKLRDAGAEVHVAAPESGEITGWDNDNWGDKVSVDLTIDQVNHDDYHALVLPGGQINPDILRTKSEAVSLVKKFVDSGKIVAAICHGPWMLVEAGVVEGREMTSYPSIKTDLINAGAKWEDSEVAISNGIITSRNPDDLDAFVNKIIEEVKEGRHERDAA